jgi:hypothetical protein
MCAVSVIEHEINVVKALSQAHPAGSPERDFFADKVGNLEFQKSTIESNVEIGILTPQRYLLNLKRYLGDQETLLASPTVKKLGAASKHAKRIAKRIELIKNEIQDMENPQEEEEEETANS